MNRGSRWSCSGTPPNSADRDHDQEEGEHEDQADDPNSLALEHRLPKRDNGTSIGAVASGPWGSVGSSALEPSGWSADDRARKSPRRARASRAVEQEIIAAGRLPAI